MPGARKAEERLARQQRGLRAFRLPVILLSRLEAFARSQDISLSAAVRLALQRGLAPMEREAVPEPPDGMTERSSVQPRRRGMLSKGVE